MATPISKITGVGPHTANVLMENGFTSVESIANTKIVDLTQVPGFGIARARKIIAAAQAILKSEKATNVPSPKKAKAKKPSKKKKDTMKKDKKKKEKTKAKKEVTKKQTKKDKKKKSEKSKKKKKASAKKKK